MKKLLFRLTLLATLLSSMAYGQVPTTGLIAEYKFTNERLDNAVGVNPFSITGTALSFENNRASGPIKSVNLNGSYLQRTGDAGYDVSVSFWMKTSTNDANKRVIIDHSVRASEAQGASETGWYTYLRNGKVGVASNFKWYHANNTSAGATGYIGWKDTESTSIISDDQWHHIVVVIDSYAGNWFNAPYQRTDRVIWQIYNVYVDGSLQVSASSVKNVGSAIHPQMRAFTDASIPVTVGNSKEGNSTNIYEELIDDLRFYNIPVDAAAVTQLAAETACSGTSGVTAAAQDITIALDAEGKASITTDDIDDGSAAVCDEPFTLSLDKMDFTCDDLGFNVVTLTAHETFATQATSTATATVTVTYVPVVSTQNITVQLDESGNATINPSDIDDGSEITGICGDALTLSLDKTTFSCADLGVNSVTLTLDDGNGNTGTAQANVTIEDNLEPEIITQDIIANVDAALGFVTIDPSQIDNGSTDNCSSGSLIMSLSKTKFTCEDTGDNVVTLTVEDEMGNISSSDATVTITSEINDETISSTNTTMCPDGTGSSTISTGSSVVGFNYTLRKDSDNSIIDGPFAGTGSGLDLVTGNLSETTAFNIIAEKELTQTQSALDFDGVNDYVNLGADNRGVTTEVTVAAWIKTTKSSASQFIASKYDYSLGYYLYLDATGFVQISGRDGSGAARGSGFSTTSVNDGDWHYIVGTVNVTSGDWKVYVDGELENSTNNGTGTTLANTTNHLVGAFSTSYSEGLIDQLTIWDTELDASSIASIVNTCLSGSETNVVGHFIFEDGTGISLTDQSTSALDGALVNMDGATDWVQVVSPSCGDKACDYQLSTVVTIGDEVAPTAVAQDISVQLDAISGEVTITADDIDNGSSDNCTSALIKSISKSTFGCGEVGDQIVTLTIEDESGNTATADATVTVNSLFVDETVTTASTSFCPDGSIGTISTGSSQVGLDYYLRDSEDNEIKDGPIAGTGSGLDFSTGNISSTTTFNVFAKLPSEGHSALDFDGVDDKIVTGYIPPATNALTIELWMKPAKTSYSRVISSYQGSSSVLAGELAIDTYDANVNNGKALRLIVSGVGNNTFSFGVPNVLTLNEWNHVAAIFDNGVIKLYVNGDIVGTSASATFSSLPLSASNIVIGEDRIQGGAAEYYEGQMDDVRIWSVARSATEISTYKNQCLAGDEIGLDLYYNLNENSALTTTDLAGANNGNLTNMDAATDWITSGVEIECGDTCDFQMTTEITIGDTEAPTAVAQNLTVQLDESGNVSVSGSNVDNGSADNCTNAESLVFSLDQSEFDCTDIGENVVTFTVEDAGGNQSSTSATITVMDEIAPTIIVQNVTVELDAQGNAMITAADVDNGSSDNCTGSETLIVDLDQLSFDCTDLGENTVLLIVEDESGNQSSENATVTVIDNIAPTLVTKNVTLSLDETGNVSVEQADVITSVVDNCTTELNLAISFSTSDFSCADLGEHTIDVIVTDASSNSVTETAVVTIIDDEAPVAIAQDINVRLDANNSATISALDINNGSTDNCNNMSVSLDITSFTLADLGQNTVTLTVTDGANNSSTATAVVTVEENKTDQTITFDALADMTYGDTDITLSATASSTLPVSFSVISGPATITGTNMSITGAGTVIVQADQNGDNDFYSASPIQRTFNVSAAILTVTASDQTISYGESTPDLTFEYSGFVNNENESALDAEPSITIQERGISKLSSASPLAVAIDPVQDAGTYDLVLDGGSDENYNFQYVNATFTVNQVQLIVTADNYTITYGDATPELTYQVSGFVLSQGLEDLDVLPALNYVERNGGGEELMAAAPIDPALEAGIYDLILSGGSDINYSLFFENGVLTVNKADQVISFEAIANREIDDPSFNLEVSASSGLDVTLSISGPATLSGTTVDLTGVSGRVSITATQGGDRNYNAATEIIVSFDVGDPCEDFTASIVSTQQVLCFNESSGGIVINVAGGLEPYSYSWSNGMETRDVSGLASGVYSVTIMDANGCSTELTTTITEPDVLSATVTIEGNSITTNVIGGTAPYEYSIDGTNFSSSNLFEGLNQGSYSVVVEDANGCMIETSTVEIIVSSAADLVSYSFYPNPVQDFLHTENIASIVLYDLSGHVVIHTGGTNDLDLRNLKSGVYLMKATTSEGETINDRLVKR
ncbi:MAG: T9SS type A sorting domain-containing protein [Reichenbachiella sp.]